MSRATYVKLDLKALEHNIFRIKEYAPNSRLLAMVKANAYGHGLKHVAGAWNHVDALGVACLSEATQLRYLGIHQPIVLMEGFFNHGELKTITDLQLEVVVHHLSQVEALENYKAPTPLTVWLKIDSGMHRLGFAPEQVADVWQRLARCPAVKSPPRLMTHFAKADHRQDQATLLQASLFTDATLNLPGERSMANSAGILAWPTTHVDWVRPGIALYGVSPFAEQNGADFGLKPVMTLVSEVIAIQKLRKGDAIGYSGLWVCPEDMPVAVVAIGYADGYPLSAGNGTPVLINGVRMPLVGRVSMDTLAVDLRLQPTVKVGDSVVLWGEGLPVEDVARHANTLSYQLLCGIAQQRVFAHAR